MMEDPYKVLGVSASASEEEITQAYRKLAKKYHPDINPGNKNAEKKMQEINAAYEHIKSNKHGGVKYEQTDGTYGPQQRQQQSQGGYYGWGSPFGDNWEDIFGNNGPFGGFYGGRWEQQNSGYSQLQLAATYIMNRQYQQALQILAGIHERNAVWYYYSALANAGTGNRITALNHAREAVRLEPNNTDYQSLLNRFEQGIYEYRQYGQGHGFDMSTMGRTLVNLWLMQVVGVFCCRMCAC